MSTAIYLRISQDRLGLELGVDRHREDCQALAGRRGWDDLVEFVDNDISATSGRKRPGYAALVEAVSRGEIQRVIVWQQSRIWRNPKERQEGIALMKRHGLSLVPVRGPEIDMTTAQGRMVADILGATDTAEGEVKAERQEREIRQRAERGLHHGGPRAYGYTADGMSLEPSEAERLGRWYAEILAGRSLNSIANEAGKTIGSMRVIMVNPRNAGLRVLRGIEYAGKWPAVVPVETWRAVVGVLTDPRRRSNTQTARRWVGAGLYRCERCGGRPVESAQNGGGTGGQLWQTYRCLKGRGGCGRSWRQDRLDAWVTQLVAARLARPDAADLLPRQRPDLEPLRTEGRALRARQKTIASGWALGSLTDEQLQAANAAITDRLVEIESVLGQQNYDGALASVILSDDPVAAWHRLIDVGQRQAFIRAMMTITLGASPRGRAPFDPERFVRIDWRTL